MSKKVKICKKCRINECDTNIKLDIDYKKLAQANHYIEEIKRRQEENQRKEQTKEFQKKLGYNTELTGATKLWNTLVCTRRLLLSPQKYYDSRELYGTKFVLRELIRIFFQFTSWGLYILTFLLVFSFLTYFDLSFLTTLMGILSLMRPFCGLFILTGVFATMFRMAAIEINAIHDINTLIGLLAVLAAFVSVAVTLFF